MKFGASLLGGFFKGGPKAVFVRLAAVAIVVLIPIAYTTSQKEKAAAEKAEAVQKVAVVVGPQLVASGFRPVTGQDLAQHDSYNMKVKTDDAYTAGSVIVLLTSGSKGEIDIKLIDGVWQIGCDNGGNFLPFSTKDPAHVTPEAVEALMATPVICRAPGS